MITGDTKTEVKAFKHQLQLPMGRTYFVLKDGTFDQLQARFQKLYPHFVPQVVYWNESGREMAVEMAHGTEHAGEQS